MVDARALAEEAHTCICSISETAGVDVTAHFSYFLNGFSQLLCLLISGNCNSLPYTSTFLQITIPFLFLTELLFQRIHLFPALLCQLQLCQVTKTTFFALLPKPVSLLVDSSALKYWTCSLSAFAWDVTTHK